MDGSLVKWVGRQTQFQKYAEPKLDVSGHKAHNSDIVCSQHTSWGQTMEKKDVSVYPGTIVSKDVPFCFLREP